MGLALIPNCSSFLQHAARVSLSRQSVVYRRGVKLLTAAPLHSGQSGFMRMFLFNRSVPERDGALENDLVVHENTHGITNRMTGGGSGRYVECYSLTLFS